MEMKYPQDQVKDRVGGGGEGITGTSSQRA